MMEWRECENSSHETPKVVRLFRLKERAVPAVVEDDENSHHQPTTQKSEEQRRQPRYLDGKIHHHPQGQKASHRIYQLPNGLRGVRHFELSHDFLPSFHRLTMVGLSFFNRWGGRRRRDHKRGHTVIPSTLMARSEHLYLWSSSEMMRELQRRPPILLRARRFPPKGLLFRT